MSFPFYFIIVAFSILENNKISCYGIRNKARLQEVPNFDMYIRPLKKLLGVFPNHEIEVQFDVAQSNVDSQETRSFYKNRALRTKNETVTVMTAKISTTKEISTTTEQSSKTGDKGNVVYMEDLKKAFDNLEKKLNVTVNCNTVTINNGTSDSQGLDIFSLMKQGAKFQKGVKKPNDKDISWIQIRVPT